MGKLVNFKDTAERLGVTEQTLRNWHEKGIIRVKPIGKARYIDESTINALQDTAEDIASSEKKLEVLRDELHQQLDIYRSDKMRDRYAKVLCGSARGYEIKKSFFAAMLHLEYAIGILKEKEMVVLLAFMNGASLEEIAKDYGCSRERIRQLVEKAIHKSSELTKIEGMIADARRATTENASLRRMLLSQKKDTEKVQSIRQQELCRLFSRSVRDCELSVRAIGCLMIDGRKTLGDVCRMKKTDFLRIRNAGKKTLREVEDFLTSKGLSWDMDVDRIIAESVL